MHGWAHGALDVEHLDVLPVLLQQGHQEVACKLHVEADLSVGQVDVSHGEGHAHDLLHLELDGGLDDLHLFHDVVIVVEQGREFARLGQTGTENTGNLLDEGAGREEVVILLGELLDELFVLVELLQVIDGHAVHADLFGSLAVSLVSENAHGGVWLRNNGQLEGSRETLVALGIVVLQGDLELDGLGEFSLFPLDLLALDVDLLATGILQDVIHRGGKQFTINLAHLCQLRTDGIINRPMICGQLL